MIYSKRVWYDTDEGKQSLCLRPQASLIYLSHLSSAHVHSLGKTGTWSHHPIRLDWAPFGHAFAIKGDGAVNSIWHAPCV